VSFNAGWRVRVVGHDLALVISGRYIFVLEVEIVGQEELGHMGITSILILPRWIKLATVSLCSLDSHGLVAGPTSIFLLLTVDQLILKVSISSWHHRWLFILSASCQILSLNSVRSIGHHWDFFTLHIAHEILWDTIWLLEALLYHHVVLANQTEQLMASLVQQSSLMVFYSSSM